LTTQHQNEDFFMAAKIDSEHNLFAGPVLESTSPSTEPQREIWTAASMSSEASLAYNESFTLVLQGDLRVDEFRKAVADLVARHDALRLTFTEDGLTICLAGTNLPELPLEDWSELNPDDREQHWLDLLARHVETPFDLVRGPLFRAVLTRWSGSEHRFVFTAHHIVCDGWSAGVVCSDLAALYNRHPGLPLNIGEAPSFVAYARALDIQQASIRKANEDYWVGQFATEIPSLDLPTNRPRPPLKTYTSSRIDVTMTGDLVSDIRRTGSKHRASLFVTLSLGFACFLSRLSDQHDIVLGIPAAGQPAGGLDSLVGHCVSMLPVRFACDPNKAFSEVLFAARGTVLDAFEHQEFTFGSLLKKLPIMRDASRLPLVSIAFNLEKGVTTDSLHFDDLSVQFYSNPRHFENFELFVNAVDMRDRIVLECQYNSDLFDEGNIRQWLDAYQVLLRSIVENADQSIGELRIITPAESEALRRWRSESNFPTPKNTVHGLIEAAVDAFPDATAVVFEGQSITYRDLDDKANALAKWLRAAGVHRDILVGICLDRSIEMVVALHRRHACHHDAFV
jgi:hypothetical protein